MIWHDCKTDPPKKSNKYILAYKFILSDETYWIDWELAYYYINYNEWINNRNKIFNCPIKWAEVDLSGVMGGYEKMI